MTGEFDCPTQNHVPGVFRMPSLTGNRDIQSGPLKDTSRLTAQYISKTLALEERGV
jgi:hypothetical protein